ncbi:hypothetical protein BX616_007302, partial [Lobosporangium transversale]
CFTLIITFCAAQEQGRSEQNGLIKQHDTSNLSPSFVQYQQLTREKEGYQDRLDDHATCKENTGMFYLRISSIKRSRPSLYSVRDIPIKYARVSAILRMLCICPALWGIYIHLQQAKRVQYRDARELMTMKSSALDNYVGILWNGRHCKTLYQHDLSLDRDLLESQSGTPLPADHSAAADVLNTPTNGMSPQMSQMERIPITGEAHGTEQSKYSGDNGEDVDMDDQQDIRLDRAALMRSLLRPKPIPGIENYGIPPEPEGEVNPDVQ